MLRELIERLLVQIAKRFVSIVFVNDFVNVMYFPLSINQMVYQHMRDVVGF